jgi:hypothetical protein
LKERKKERKKENEFADMRRRRIAAESRRIRK